MGEIITGLDFMVTELITFLYLFSEFNLCGS
uniref:Uncharacterized protein n=1 Tax=Arundo donax TaxID=35708 RepID=A0A0A9EUE4_ARUDO